MLVVVAPHNLALIHLSSPPVVPDIVVKLIRRTVTDIKLESESPTYLS